MRVTAPLQFNPPIIAHRGASGFAPENTLTAFRFAKTLGMQWVEFDVMLANCGTAVVIHDDTLDRTTNGRGKVADFTYQELRQLDAGSWFDKSFVNEKIPTLRDTLKLCAEVGLAANIELKPVPGSEIFLVKTVFNILQEEKIKNPLLLTSFSVEALREVRFLSADIAIGHLMETVEEGWEVICDELKCAVIDLNQNVLTEELVRTIKKRQRLLLSYTVNEVQRARQLISWGVDAVFSDKLVRI